MIYTYITHNKSHFCQKISPERDFYEGRQQQRPTKNSVSFGKNVMLDDKTKLAYT